MPVFANEKDNDTDAPLVLKLETEARSLDGLRDSLEFAADVMRAWCHWSDDGCRRTRLPFGTLRAGMTTPCKFSIDRAGRTTLNGAIKGVGIMAVECRANKAIVAFVFKDNESESAYLQAKSTSPAFDLKVEREKLVAQNRIVAGKFRGECADEYLATDKWLYFSCIDYRSNSNSSSPPVTT